MFRDLDWVQRAAQQYTSPDASAKFVVETNITRAQDSINLLEEKVLPAVKNPNILLVGIGFVYSDVTLVCSYTPFLIAAHLESKGIPYKMTLVDIVDKVIEDVRTRTHLFLTNNNYHERKDERAAWDQYLTVTKQTDCIVHDKETLSGLKFTDFTEQYDPDYPTSWYLKGGVRAARVPEGFRTRLETGEITLVEGDIASIDLKGHEKFDYIECLNIFYQLSPAGQVLALANMAEALNRGGRLFLNDLEFRGTQLFIELGGWLDEYKLKQLGLVKEKKLEINSEDPGDTRARPDISARALLLKT